MMARVKKNPKPDHYRIAISTDDDGEVLLIRGRKRCYVWAGRENAAGSQAVTISGPKTLEKFARAILKELGAAGQERP